MSTKARADVLLTISSDVADLRKTQEEFARTRKEALEFAKIGTAFAAANQAVTGALNGIKAALKGTIVQGVQFNATLEQAQLGVASVLKQFNPDDYKTFNEAIKASSGVIAELRKQAVETPATFEELLEGFQGTAGAMASANIPLAKQVQLVVMASQSMTTLGIATRELRQEVTALMMGNIDRNARLAQTLGITSADIRAAKERGQLYEFLADKMAAFSQGAKLATGNIAVLQSNLKDATTLQAADATVELAEAYRELLGSLTDLVKSDSFKQVVEMTAGVASTGTRLIAGTADIVRENPGIATGLATGLTSAVGVAILTKAFNSLSKLLYGPVISLGHALGLTLAVGFSQGMIQAAITEGGAALDAVLEEEAGRIKTLQDVISGLKEAQDESGVLATIQRAETQLAKAKKELAEWQNERTEIMRNTPYGKQELARISGEIEQYQRILNIAKARGEEIIKQNKALADQRGELERIHALNDERAKLTKTALDDDGYFKAVEAERKARFANMSPAQQVADLKSQIQSAKFSVMLSPKASDLAKLGPDGSPGTPTADNIRAAETLRLEATARLLALTDKLADLEKKITAEKSKQAKEADEAAEKILRERLERQEVALHERLDDIAARRAIVEADTAATVGEKRRANIALIREERAELEKMIATLLAQKAAASNGTERQLVQKRIDDAYSRLRDNRTDEGRATAEPVRGLERFRTELRQTAEDSDTMFSVLDGGFNGLQSGFMDALTSARNFGDGVRKVLSSLGLGIANAIMQIISMKMAMGLFTLGAGLFSGGLSAGAAAAAGTGATATAVSGATAATSIMAAGGGTFYTQGRTNLTVGDNPGGVELVSVIPISGRGQTRLNGRNLAMAGGGTALIDNMRIPRPPRISLPNFNSGDSETVQRDQINFNYTFHAGVTRQEVAAMIPIIEQRTIQKWEELQRRRRM